MQTKQKRITRVITPTVLQMEAVECGAASLAIVLAYYGKTVSLEQLRADCGVSRDGSKAGNLLKAARQHGLEAKGYRKEPTDLRTMPGPMIIHWNFNHFLVLEGFKNGKVYLNDPASGPRTVTEEEFDQAFTGVVLVFEPTEAFERGGETKSFLVSLKSRLTGSHAALVFVIMAGLGLVLPGLVIPVFSKVFIDQVLLGGIQHWMGPLLIGMALTMLLRAALTWLQVHYLLRLETKLALSTASRFFWHILRLPVDFFHQRYGGEIGSRVAINDRVAQLLSGQLAVAFLDVCSVGFYLILMFRYDPLLTSVGVCMAALNLVYLKYVSRRRMDVNRKLLLGRGNLLGTAMSGLQSIETLKASGAEADFFAKWSGNQAKMVNAEQELGATGPFLSAVPRLLSALATTAVLAIGGLQIMNGDMTIGMLVAFQSLMASFLAPVTHLVNLGGQLQEVQGDMNRLDDVQGYPVDRLYALQPDAEPVRLSTPKLQGFVELGNVTFGYSRLEHPLIENFSLSLKPGTRVALIGGSGSGKSTIAKLVAGLYEPWSGEIRFDGDRYRELPRELVHHSVAVVDQDISLFEGTIRDNLTLWDETVSEADMIRAAKDACIHEEIAARKEGYLERVEEGGRNFSGGQRQRMEIARALVGNPSIMILDEATSALDPKTEKWITDRLRRRGCTCIVVAHRLSTIRDCDEIVILDRGKVVQRGTHVEMSRNEGPYRTLIHSH